MCILFAGVLPATTLTSGSVSMKQCDAGEVVVIDSVETPNNQCSVEIYRALSSKCLGESSCSVTYDEYPCLTGTLTLAMKCVNGKLSNLCTLNNVHARPGKSNCTCLIYSK